MSLRDLKVFLTALLCSAAVGCSSVSPTEPTDDGSRFAYTESPASGVLVAGVDRSGDGVAVLASHSLANSGAGGIGAITFSSGVDGSEMTVVLGRDGLPSSLSADGHLYVLGGYTTSTVNIAELKLDGTVVQARGIPLPVPLSELRVPSGLQGDLLASYSPSTLALRLSATIRWAAISLRAVGCIAEIGAVTAAGAGTAGAAFVLAPGPLAACGSVGLEVLGRLTGDEQMVRASEALGFFGCAAGSPTACVNVVLGHAVDEIANTVEREEQRREQLQVTRGALDGGGGALQITLTWSGISDLDLHVTDPFGFEIYFASRRSPSGGELDRDDTDGFGPENVRWLSAPNGRYLLDIVHYRGNAAESYTVLVSTPNGLGRLLTGTIQPGLSRRVAQVDLPGGQVTAAVVGLAEGADTPHRAARTKDNGAR